MLSRILTLLFLLVFLPAPQKQALKSSSSPKSGTQPQRTQDPCAALRSENNQLRSRLKEAGNLQSQLDQMRNKLNACNDQNRQLQSASDQLKIQLEQTRAKLNACGDQIKQLQTQYDQIRVQLGQKSNELNLSESQKSRLQSQSEQLTAQRDQLTTQRDQLTTQRDQLTTQRDQLTAQRDQLARQLADRDKEITRINAQNSELVADNHKWAESLKSAQQARVAAERSQAAAEQARTDLEGDLAKLTAEQRKRPEILLGLLNEYQKKMDQNGEAALGFQTKDGTLVRQLVIGTLEVKPYPTEVPADQSLQLIALFTPHPLPGMIDKDTSWHVKLNYAPPPGIKVDYNEKDSLGVEDREVRIGPEYKWVWTVDLPKDSDSVAKPTEIDILAGFEKDKLERIAGQPVILTKGKPAPGLFARVFAALKENLSYILATITTLCGIWAGILTVKIKRYELDKRGENSEKRQPAPPPT